MGNSVRADGVCPLLGPASEAGFGWLLAGDWDADPRAGCDLGASLHAVDHARFNSSLSTTFSGISETYSLSYGFGDLSVVLGYDTVTVSDFYVCAPGEA